MTLPLTVPQSTVSIDNFGTGAITFVTLVDVVDGIGNVILEKNTIFRARLDANGDAIITLPADIGIRVFINTSTLVRQEYITVPLSLATLDFVDLLPSQPTFPAQPQVTQEEFDAIADVPWRVLFYYGIPESVNASPSLEAAAQFFSGHDYITFGEGLQFPTHPNHANTLAIITRIKEIRSSIRIFGYINIGVSIGNESIADLQNKMDLWKDAGVHGIFMDLAGYDFDVPRSRQNTLIDYAHSLDMPVFVNAFDPDDVMDSSINATFNPTGVPTQMNSADFYLIESWVVNSIAYAARNGYNLVSEIDGRAQSSIAYRQSLGVTILSVNGIDYSAHSDVQIEEWFHACQTVAAIYSIPFGVNTYEYSSIAPNVNVAGVHNYDTSWRRWFNTDIPRILNGNRISRPDIGMAFTGDHTTLTYSFEGPHIKYVNDADRFEVLGRLVVPGNERLFFITELPFATDLTSILTTGDRFTYPKGHAQHGEIYRWDGATWQLETTLTALPNSVLGAVQQIMD